MKQILKPAAIANEFFKGFVIILYVIQVKFVGIVKLMHVKFSTFIFVTNSVAS